MEQEKKYLSHVIEEEYLDWDLGSRVLITAPTGSGKTTFVLEKLLPQAAEEGMYVVYICNRLALQEQVKKGKLKRIEDRINGADGKGTTEADLEKLREYLIITTYQSCESNNCFPRIRYRDTSGRVQYIEPGKIMYYIFDEAHYFISDASFNSRTGFWANRSASGTMIYMTATPEPLFLFLTKEEAHTDSYPDRRISCMSAYCIDVAKLAQLCELEFAWSQEKLYLFGMLAIHEV